MRKHYNITEVKFCIVKTLHQHVVSTRYHLTAKDTQGRMWRHNKGWRQDQILQRKVFADRVLEAGRIHPEHWTELVPQVSLPLVHR